MKIILSFEKTQTKDTSIMVDALRASTTITLALNTLIKSSHALHQKKHLS